MTPSLNFYGCAGVTPAFRRKKTIDAPTVHTKSGSPARRLTIPLADQKVFGSLTPYAEKAAIRTRADPIQPTNASQRGRILVVAPSEPAAPRNNAIGTSPGGAPTTPEVSYTRRTWAASAGR